MLICLVLFIIISSGSIFITTYFKRKYEESVPLTIFSIVFILYFSGIFGFLKVGVYIVCAISMILYLLSIFWIIKNKKLKTTLLNTFTPAFFIYVFTFLVLIWGNYHRLACNWDEFSHWADIVKAMYTINDFGTNPLSYSFFKSYPPAMSLFQYFIQILNGNFTEWLLYFSYQIFSLSLFMPFLKDLKFKNISKILLTCIIVFIIPTIFFNDFYKSILIDAFLGLLFGFSLSIIFINKKYDVLNIATVLLAIFTLVLTKDAGFLFAIITLIAFILDLLFFVPLVNINKKRNRIKKFMIIVIAILTLIISKFTWHYEIINNKVIALFAQPINIKEYFSIIINYFMGASLNYRGTILTNFITSFLTTGIQIGSLIIYNYQILIILIIGLYCLDWIYNNYDSELCKKKRSIIWATALSSFLYLIGLIACYMYKFPEDEAISLASYQRYINIIYTMIIMFISTSLIHLFTNTTKYKKICVVLLAVVLLSAPFTSINNFVTRANVRESINIRLPYVKLTDKVNNLIDDDNANIFFISQGNNGYDYWVMRYSLRPNHLPNAQWSLGEPFYDGDIWTVNITPKEWHDQLEKGYDYVLIYQVNDYFVKNYSSNFKNPCDVEANNLYKVNKATGLLELVK